VRASSRIWCPGKAALIPGEWNGSLKRERAGWVGGGRESKVSARSAPDPSHGTKMLGKTPLTKKAHKKSLTSKSKVSWQAQTAKLTGERWRSTDGPGLAFIEEGG
jgi:hypothetical protein